MSTRDLLSGAQLCSSGAVSVFSLALQFIRDTVIDCGELAGWIDEEVSARRLSPLLRVKLVVDFERLQTQIIGEQPEYAQAVREIF